MAIVKEKVKEYQNGAFVRSYSQINIPASVAKSVGDTVNTLEDTYAEIVSGKQDKIEKTYRNLKETIEFLYQFKDLNSDYENNVSFIKDKIDRTFNKYYKTDKKGEIIFNTKYSNILILSAIIGFILSIAAGIGSLGAISVILFFTMFIWVFFIKIPLTLRNARKGFEEIYSDFKRLNLFSLANEFTIVLNHYHSDEQKVKVYNNEISKEDFQKNIENSLQKVIQDNFVFNELYQISNNNIDINETVDLKKQDTDFVKTEKKNKFNFFKFSMIYIISIVISIIVMFFLADYTLPEGITIELYMQRMQESNGPIILFAISALVITAIFYFLAYISRKLRKQAI